MCIEFQHLSCRVVVIKGLAYLLTYFIAIVIAACSWFCYCSFSRKQWK